MQELIMETFKEADGTVSQWRWHFANKDPMVRNKCLILSHSHFKEPWHSTYEKHRFEKDKWIVDYYINDRLESYFEHSYQGIVFTTTGYGADGNAFTCERMYWEQRGEKLRRYVCVMNVDGTKTDHDDPMRYLPKIRLRSSSAGFQDNPFTFLVDDVLDTLVQACLEHHPHHFLQLLSLPFITTGMPDKEVFYGWFLHMYTCGRKRSVGEWYFKKKQYDSSAPVISYCFFDQVHTHPCFSVEVTQNNGGVHFDVLPF